MDEAGAAKRISLEGILRFLIKETCPSSHSHGEFHKRCREQVRLFSP
jgi:hypothetical protein